MKRTNIPEKWRHQQSDIIIIIIIIITTHFQERNVKPLRSTWANNKKINIGFLTHKKHPKSYPILKFQLSCPMHSLPLRMPYL